MASTVANQLRVAEESTGDRASIISDGLDTVREVAAFTKLSVATIYDLMSRGELPYCKLGKSRRIPHRSVLDYVNRCLVTR
jgi:excisionase family DNA binding protein